MDDPTPRHIKAGKRDALIEAPVPSGASSFSTPLTIQQISVSHSKPVLQRRGSALGAGRAQFELAGAARHRIQSEGPDRKDPRGISAIRRYWQIPLGLVIERVSAPTASEIQFQPES